MFSLPPTAPEEFSTWLQLLVQHMRKLETENCELKELVLKQSATIGELRDEIAALKGQKGRPIIKPSGMDKGAENDQSEEGKNSSTPKARGKRASSGKPAKTARLNIHEERTIKVDDAPDGSRFLGHRKFTVQDLRISAHNTCFLLERWATPDGRVLTAKRPDALGGLHFGPVLRTFIAYQHHHCHVTQPKLHEQLLELGVQISTGQVNALLNFGHDGFGLEKAGVLKTGLQISPAITVDDSGARHQGKNGYVTVVSSATFAWFGSANNKSRIGFLTHLHDNNPIYALGDVSWAYMKAHGLKLEVIESVQTFSFQAGHWSRYLDWLGIADKRHRTIVSEAALLGGLLQQGLNPDLVVVSDGARQFDVLMHALCWVHAERLVHKLIAPNDLWRAQQDRVRAQIWAYYGELKAFKKAPTPEMVAELEAKFDALFGQSTGWVTLDLQLERTLKQKQDLLRVLSRPEIPLNTNASETDIRDYVKVRKISGGTRSDLGRQCRDTFASLKKTCRKLNVSFWAYLYDRITSSGHIAPLPDLMRQRTSAANLATSF